MELRHYWNVIWRRRWLVLAILLLTTLVSGYMALGTPRTYQTDVWFITRQEPTPDSPGMPGVVGSGAAMVFTFNRYYNWFGSEFLVDDYTQIVTSDAFANSVLETMREPGYAGKVMEDFSNQAIEAAGPGGKPDLRSQQDVDRLNGDIGALSAASLRNLIEADRKHRELRLTVTTRSLELTKAVADAAGIVLTDARLKPIKGELVDDKAVFAQLNEVGPATVESSRNRDILNAAIRVLVGLVAALALAFLLEYLDTTVRDERDAARVLELPVIGTIPRG